MEAIEAIRCTWNLLTVAQRVEAQLSISQSGARCGGASCILVSLSIMDHRSIHEHHSVS